MLRSLLAKCSIQWLGSPGGVSEYCPQPAMTCIRCSLRRKKWGCFVERRVTGLGDQGGPDRSRPAAGGGRPPAGPAVREALYRARPATARVIAVSRGPAQGAIAARSRAAFTAADSVAMSYAPWWRRPLTKNVGVPATPDRS